MIFLFVILTFPCTCICYCEDFILTDFYRNKFIQIGQDFSIFAEHDVPPGTSADLKTLSAGRTDNIMTLYWLNDKLLVQSAKLEETKVIDEAKDVDLKETQISSFEMSSNFSKLFFSTDEGIFQFDVETRKTSAILNNTFVTALSIHFEKKQLYYSKCRYKRGSLVTHDFEKHEEVAKVELDFCLQGIGYDEETEILFVYTNNGIYEKTSRDSPMELRYFRTDANISSVAVGTKYLFFVNFQQSNNDVYKLPKIAKPIKMVMQLSYDIPPHIVNTEDGLIVLSVTDQKLLKLSRNYGIEMELKIEIEKETIRSLKYKKTQASEKLFWIHLRNAGKVVYVEIKNGIQIDRKEIIFSIPIGENLEDIELDDSGDKLYLSYNSDIHLGKLSDSSTEKLASLDSDVFSMKLIPNENVLMVSGCSKDNGDITELDFKTQNLKQNSKRSKICIHKLDIDREKVIFGSSSSAIYVVDIQSNQFVKLCSADDVISLVVDDANVYFTAADDKNTDKKLFRIKKQQATKSEDLLTEQKNPALISFIEDIPKINKFSKCSKIETMPILVVFLLMLRNHL